MLLDWVGDDYPRFPEFQRMLREYEREMTAVAAVSAPAAWAIQPVVVVEQENRARVGSWHNGGVTEADRLVRQREWEARQPPGGGWDAQGQRWDRLPGR